MTHLEDFIKQFYSQIGIENPEELNIQDIANRLCINVYYWNEQSQALVQRNQAFIFLNIEHSPSVQWQEFCHELGHVLLHAGDQMLLPYSFVEYQEFKANNFAYHAAVPTFMLNRLDLPDVYHEAVQLIKKEFHVSGAFAAKRLNHYINNHLYASQIIV
ncbi:ImmA/IrrE family metallo-endopeptidase [Rummeliibacillus sp. JY-2-4R]